MNYSQGRVDWLYFNAFRKEQSVFTSVEILKSAASQKSPFIE
jgi:hypothetical protein